ncbi:uncharacterized protein LOC123311331 [Coccinella septempunctata]|uniref:uncharacterized protein LOC123311331 n=1 Tax=Coccinella septempunctata TaxID=41139 RepID=UPI001D073A90|nr:uncharacterized protein LOC123311331 [Coccinella septempunctata]
MSRGGRSKTTGSKNVYIKAPTGLTPASPGLYWIDSEIGQNIPQNAFTGLEADGSEVYLGRTNIDGNELLARIPNKEEAYAFYEGEEIPVTKYQILVQKQLMWIRVEEGRIPPNSVTVGADLYIGRKNGFLGQVSSGELRVTISGEQRSFKNYEILVYQ